MGSLFKPHVQHGVMIGSVDHRLCLFVCDILWNIHHLKRLIHQNFKQQPQGLLTGKLTAGAGTAAYQGFGDGKTHRCVVRRFAAVCAVDPEEGAVRCFVAIGKAPLVVFSGCWIRGLEQYKGFGDGYEITLLILCGAWSGE